jgi:hypothetical protein
MHSRSEVVEDSGKQTRLGYQQLIFGQARTQKPHMGCSELVCRHPQVDVAKTPGKSKKH